MSAGKSIITAAVILAALGWKTATAESCSRGWVCVDTAQSAERVEVVARNLQPFAITVSLRMVSRRLGRDARRTTTKSVPGGGSVVLKSFPALAKPGSRDYRYYYDWTVGSLAARHDDDYMYRLPYQRGSAYSVLQGFGSRFSHTGLEHYTVDFNMPVGTPVHAAREGVVAMVEESNTRGCWDRGCGKYANYLVIQHADGTTGEYYHLSHEGVLVEQGDFVHKGQLIAMSGNTGHTTLPHLHFGVYKPVSWGRTRSLPFRFQTDRGVLERPRAGRSYGVD